MVVAGGVVERSPRLYSVTALTVPIQYLNPDVFMMQPFKDWNRGDAADLLHPPKIWSIFVQ